LDTFGHVLLEQQRYRDAIASFESSIAEWAERGSAHRGIAETLLRSDSPPAAANHWASLAVKLGRDYRAVPFEAVANLAEALATLAWAVSRHSGDVAEVDRLLGEAFSLCGKDTIPVLALVHYCSGQAYLALGIGDAATRHFQQAANADPRGNYGRLAAAALSHPA
jgi:tetratricopeptide (TPR) repeat protein